MSIIISSNIVRDGLILYMDAANTKSYSGGTAWSDMSGRGYVGALINGPTFSNTKEIQIDGVNDWVHISHGGELSLSTGGFTIMAWQRMMTGVGNSSGIMSNDNGGDSAYGIRTAFFWPDHLYALCGGYNIEYPNFTPYVYHHYAMSYDGIGTMSGYFDGSFHATASAVSPSAFNNLILGGSRYQNSLGGTNMTDPMAIGVVQIYNRQLSASEISQNYEALKTRFK